jgi:DnaJ-class molecular chaperone
MEIMGKWSKAAGTGIGFYLGGATGALLGYFIGKFVGNRARAVPAKDAMAGCYETLRVSPTAEIEEIKQSYRMLAKRYHPDLQDGMDREKAIVWGERMAKINEAYKKIRKARNF